MLVFFSNLPATIYFSESLHSCFVGSGFMAVFGERDRVEGTYSLLPRSAHFIFMTDFQVYSISGFVFGTHLVFKVLPWVFKAKVKIS